MSITTWSGRSFPWQLCIKSRNTTIAQTLRMIWPTAKLQLLPVFRKAIRRTPQKNSRNFVGSDPFNIKFASATKEYIDSLAKIVMGHMSAYFKYSNPKQGEVFFWKERTTSNPVHFVMTLRDWVMNSTVGVQRGHRGMSVHQNLLWAFVSIGHPREHKSLRHFA